MTSKKLSWVKLLVALAAVALFFPTCRMACFMMLPEYRMGHEAESLKGKQIQEVIRVLGEPSHVLLPEHQQSGRSLNEPWEEMHFVPVPTRRVTGKVLLYKRGWIAVYLFISPTGIVEAVEHAGT